MKRLIVDTSSLMWTCLSAGKDSENGKQIECNGKLVQVNSADYGYDNAMNSLTTVMDVFGFNPDNVIFVVEGEMSKVLRCNLMPGYKGTRGERPPEVYAAFNTAKTMLVKALCNLGAQAVTQNGVEADDVIAYLATELDGDLTILSNDGDLSILMNDRVSQIRMGALLHDNPFGPFPLKFITLYKALVGDSSDNIKGAAGFGNKAFLDMLVKYGEPGLAAIEGMIQRKTLAELEEDVPDFKPMQKVIDSATNVYASYSVAKLYPEWCNTTRQPIKRVELGEPEANTEFRLKRWADHGVTNEQFKWETKVGKTSTINFSTERNHAVFDCELIGKENPVFLTCVRVIETGETASFWHHIDGDMGNLHTMLKRDDLTFVSFNGINFDAPLIAAAIAGKNTSILKFLADKIVNEDVRPWQLAQSFNFDMIPFDHIDLMEVSPGVHISLKAFAGRMGYKTMVDMPFHHDTDLTPEQLPVVEAYCQNDLGVTEALFQQLRDEINLRMEMSVEHGIDLRSKSDAQVAEALLKKAAGITKGGGGRPPATVTYTPPAFIKTDSVVINDLIEKLTSTAFKINPESGRAEAPLFLKDPIQLGYGTYQVGVGGLHSTHDKQLYVEADGEDTLISDFDVASFYPFVMINAGITPRIDNGAEFVEAYKKVLFERIAAKRRIQEIEREIGLAMCGNKIATLNAEHKTRKSEVGTKKVVCVSAFGKLGSSYCAFYSPDLLLAVTLSGQIHLLTLIYELEIDPSIKVISANTDGIMLQYPARLRETVINVITKNAVRTGFEYEETPYAKVALSNVNNYIAVTRPGDAVIISPDGTVATYTIKGNKAKTKGLFAEAGLMKNPTMQVCSNMIVDYLRDGVLPHVSIDKYTDMRDFVSIRAVKGGGVQYAKMIEVDDWVLVNDLGTKDNAWKRQAWLDAGDTKAPVKRKSRPPAVEVGVDGVEFGRMARWYMSNEKSAPICYVGSGNKVPKTDGAKLCMTLPDTLPDDLDLDWYINESLQMMRDLGINLLGVEDQKSAVLDDELEAEAA